MDKDYVKTKLEILLSSIEDMTLKFTKNYDLELHNDFINSKDDKKHNISSHSKWFRKKINLNHLKESKAIINKWKICMVDYGMNIGTEINGIRPSIIFKNANYKYGEDIIVIPMTSYLEEQEETKSVDEFDIEIKASEENGLDNNSLLKIRQLRCVSKKRFKLNRRGDNIIIKGELEDKYYDLVESKVKTMLGI